MQKITLIDWVVFALQRELDGEIAMKVWVLTREENQYDQFGEYFDAVFSKKPTVEQVMEHVGSKKIAEHVLGSGGRISDEDTWYFLREVDC